MKIGFLNRGHVTWTAGSSYTRSMVEAMASARSPGVEICVLGGSDAPLPTVVGVGLIRADGPHPTPAEISALVSAHGVDVLLPVTETLPADIACALVGWIPDFQHRRLPRYFTLAQTGHRDAQFEYLAANCDAMLCSSAAVRGDLAEFYPAVADHAAVVPFPSSVAYFSDDALGDPRAVAAKYGLPPAYAVVINQFWRHKNHRLVVEAVARARVANTDVFVVMAGMLYDYRDPTNAHVSEIVQRTFREGLFANLAILGEIPVDDLVALLRSAVVVVQPSEFEGWNTTVQDAIAFGKRLACSDIPVHHEQAPGAFFFGLDDASALADFLASLDWLLPGWDGTIAEMQALSAERARGREWGARAIALCRNAVAWHEADPGRRGRYEPSAEVARAHPPARIRQLAGRVRALESELTSLRHESREQAERLRGQLAQAREEARVAVERYGRERRKRLREHIREALFGRRD